ncbi:TIGR03943 family putative permease subunit [Cyanobium sp. CH-040]|uniref:TIGR03943 family putative permease subunit n=1 Tax=Cyanobium sp. CH-040 TaxID=2823708 RepID=UPI0020CFAD98|nr:TIGR03943 family protein [Cyanobium sp. CH-040]MCP9928866.1 TIGR03943 family protein [Cyanobium sp. CH-040]
MRGVALALWAVVLRQSSVDGRLDLLLRAAFHPLVSAAGGVLLILAVAQVLAGLRSWGDEPDRASRQDRRLSAATAAIAALVIALPPNPSFADLASQRPADDTASETLSFVLPPAQRSLTDWVRMLRSQPDPQLFDGDPVRISGFVLPKPDGPPQLARLLVRCCLADATPVGLPVRWPAGDSLPRADQWLAIEGRMAVEDRRLVVVPERIQPIPRPARPLEP